MQHIRYHEMEDLLKNYKMIEGMISSIRRESAETRAKGDDHDINDDIANLVLRRADFDGVASHTIGNISDRTAKIAINYADVLEHEKRNALQEIDHDLFLLEMVFDKLNIGLNVIPELHKGVIVSRYLDRLDWYAVEDKFAITKSTAQKMRREGVEKITKISRISMDIYQQVIKILGS